MFGLTLDINKEKYTKLSVVLFSVVLRVGNFLLSLFVQLFPCCVENLLSRYSPPIMQGPSCFYGSQFSGGSFVVSLSVLNFWGML